MRVVPESAPDPLAQPTGPSLWWRTVTAWQSGCTVQRQRHAEEVEVWAMLTEDLAQRITAAVEVSSRPVLRAILVARPKDRGWVP